MNKNLKFTGERVIPNCPEIEHLYQEHLVRYRFASQYAQSKVVLDFGCGTGYGSYLLHEKGARKVVGVDISKDAIDYCNSNYKANNLEFKSDDCTKCQLQNSTFDIIVSFEVIEHLKMVDCFLSEVKRLLKKNGLFVVSTPNKLTYQGSNKFHVTEYTEQEFRALLKKYFTYVEIFYQSYPAALAIYKPGRSEKITEIDIPHLEIKNVESAMYFVAVCADNKIENYSNKLYLFNNKTYIQEEYSLLKKQVNKLERDLKTKNMQTSRLELEMKYNNLNSNDSKSALVAEYKKQIHELQLHLDEANMKLDNMYKSFTKNTMLTYQEEILDRIYREMLGRPPDELAIKHFLPRLISNEISERDLRKLISESDEAKSVQ